MRTPFYVFIAIFFSLFAAVSFYIGFRGWQSFARNNGYVYSWIYWGVYWVVALSYIIARVSGSFLPSYANNALLLLGSYWMAAMIYFLLFIIIIDIIRLADRWVRFLPGALIQDGKAAFYIGTTVVIIVLGILVYGTWNAHNPKITRYDVNIAKKAGPLDRLHIVMASDLHLGKVVRKDRLDAMVDGINRLKPDLVLLPGDIFDDDTSVFEDGGITDALSRINAGYGVYAALGNHEYFSGRIDDVAGLFEKGGVKLLRDSSLKVGDSFYIAGREDLSAERYVGKPRQALAEILDGADKQLPVILMDHQPFNLGESESNGVDLQVSGHTHQGQLFPFKYITGMIYEVDWGYLKKGALNVIVTSGYGTWGPPIRTGNYPELVVIDVKFDK